jgi:hypothetical protein
MRDCGAADAGWGGSDGRKGDGVELDEWAPAFRPEQQQGASQSEGGALEKGAAVRPLSEISYDTQPNLMVIGRDAGALAQARSAAAAFGCRIAATCAPHEALRRLGRQVALDAVLLVLGGTGLEAAEPLWKRLCSAAETGRFNSLVVAPAPVAAELAARPRPQGVRLLGEPDGLDWLAGIAAAIWVPPLRLHDAKGAGGGAPRLQQIAEEVERIASMLSALSEENEAAAEAAKGKVRVDAGLVRGIIRSRRLRDQFFRSDLFADPAWDMMLDLFAARLEQRKVAVSSLCIAAAVPPTTALRWIKSLCDQGLFVRKADPEDGRRVFIELGDAPAAALEAYLRAAQRISPLAV